MSDANGKPITTVMLRHAKEPGAIFWEVADASDYAPAKGSEKIDQLLKAVFALSDPDADEVPLDALARRLKCSVKTVRRYITQATRTEDGEVLRIKDSRVFVEEQL
jgi:hypothetical protein